MLSAGDVARKGHSKYLRTLQLGVRVGGVVENACTDVRIDRAAFEADELMRRGDVEHTIGDESEGDAIPFWRQGDASLATRKKFKSRFGACPRPGTCAPHPRVTR